MSETPTEPKEFSSINPEMELGHAPKSSSHKEVGADAGVFSQKEHMSPEAAMAHLAEYDSRNSAALASQARWQKAWWKRMGAYAILALISFFVFLYFSFPFAVLKETLVSAVSEQLRVSGLEVRLNIGSLRPSYITGIEIENATITNIRDSSAQMKFEEVVARVRIFPLFLGRIGISLHARQGKGTFDAMVSLPVSGLISGNPKLSEADFKFNSFAIDGFIDQGLGMLKGSTNPTMALILPLISVTSAGGSLSGSMNFDGSELNSIERFKGKIKLDVKGMFLHIADNVWQIPKQDFSAARIEASLDSGSVNISENTRFVAPDIEVGLNGKIQPGDMGMSAALALKISMRRRIQQNIGNLVPAVLKCLQPLRENPLPDGTNELVLDAKLNGPLMNMTCDQS